MIDRLIDWYWDFGSQRKGGQEIPLGWLAAVYQNSRVVKACDEGRQNSVMSVGVWGPSQSGKSTLISGLCDQMVQEDGAGGALDWGTPVRFSSDETVAGDAIVFNPHNLGSDASGCVSRFYQAERVDDPGAPVSIDLLTRAELMHALAAGYSSECRTEAAWTPQSVESLIVEVASSASKSVNREAFESAVELCDVISLLIHSRDDRFRPLSAAKFDLADRLLSDRSVVGDQQAVNELTLKLLWDDHTAVTDVFNAMLKLKARLPSRAIRCSMEVAALLVNIESYNAYLDSKQTSNSSPAVQKLVKAIDGLASEPTANGIRLVVKQGGMFSSAAEYGWFQGLIRELKIPLRSEAIKGDGERAFFETSDLVDFPGVPNQDRDTQEKQLDLSNFEEHGDRGGDPMLLTKVLKRGKVASLVVDYGQSMQLDAFLLLARARDYPPKPERLHSGITSWWKSFDPTYDVYADHVGRPPLPVFFNLTFFGGVIDIVGQRAATGGLQPLVQMIEQLDPLVDPSVATMLVTSYKKFKDGQIQLEPALAKKAVEEIASDVSFKKRLADQDSLESLSKVLSEDDGGVGHLFSVLARSLQPMNRTVAIQKRRTSVIGATARLIADCMPGSSDDLLKRDIEKLKAKIKETIEDRRSDPNVVDPVALVSLELRKLFDLPFDHLDAIPPAGSDRSACERYMQEQLSQWANRDRMRGNDRGSLRLEKASLKRILEMLAASVSVAEIATWLHSDMPQQRTTDECKELRRVLSPMLLSKMLQPSRSRTIHPEHGSKGEIAEKAKAWADTEATGLQSLNGSPHFAAVIDPLLDRLSDLAEGRKEGRPEQIGDEEVAELYAAISSG